MDVDISLLNSSQFEHWYQLCVLVCLQIGIEFYKNRFGKLGQAPFYSANIYLDYSRWNAHNWSQAIRYRGNCQGKNSSNSRLATRCAALALQGSVFIWWMFVVALQYSQRIDIGAIHASMRLLDQHKNQRSSRKMRRSTYQQKSLWWSINKYDWHPLE